MEQERMEGKIETKCVCSVTDTNVRASSSCAIHPFPSNTLGLASYKADKVFLQLCHQESQCHHSLPYRQA